MLYRTYRPKGWGEVVGQEHVVQTLKGALIANRIGHAYLFAGPRGTGKTTLARIWAKAVNCTAKKDRPCGVCDSCVAIDEGRSLDLIEIDAASNRGIEDVRALKETAATSPSSSVRKIFIIDEVHMLSKDAFNALLKLLEEPPAHAVFVLATTEPHKVLPTVLSRVQRFDFRKLTQSQIAGKLERIATQEKLKVTPEALAALAAASDGAMRDAEVMLTKLASHTSGGAIGVDTVQAILGLVPHTWHAGITSMMASGDRAGALRALGSAADGGADMDSLTRGLLEFLRSVMVTKIDPAILASVGLADAHAQSIGTLATSMNGAFLVKAIQVFTRARTELKSSPIPSLPLELAVIELTEKAS